jgi:nitrate/nitrite transport system permease protein
VAQAAHVAGVVLPPGADDRVVGVVWQVLCSSPDASLPPPTKVLADTHELITAPVLRQRRQRQGMFWHLLASLKRVALGILWRPLRDRARRADRQQQVGRCARSIRCSRCCGRFRRSPGCRCRWRRSATASPRHLRDLHHRDLADHHQHRGGHPQHPAGLSQRRAGAAAQRREFFTTIMLPAAAPYIFTGLRIGIGLSWLAIVAAEMLIGGVGIGFFIWDAWNSSLISDIILALVYVGVIGFLLDRLVAVTGKLIGRGTVSV